MKKLKITGMRCMHCVQAVRDVLTEAGASAIDISLEDGTAICDTELSEDALADLLEEEGFTLTAYEEISA